MCEDEECTICLEPITATDSIGLIPNCKHYYHNKCILQWSSHSNSCPKCRDLFYTINNYRNIDAKELIGSIDVKDKLLANDAINNIPEEFIIRANQPTPILANNPIPSPSTPGICSICSSADYRLARLRSLISCQVCNSLFHIHCLGITGTNSHEYEQWCCPMCDSPQELIMPSASALNRRPIQRRAPAMPIWPGNRSLRPRLIIHNDNHELDDDFLYSEVDDTEVVTIPPFLAIPTSTVLNGGVILRREMRQLENLTPDEAQAWSMFEESRNGNSLTDNQLNPSTSQSLDQPRRRRRRKQKRAEEEHLVTSSSIGASSKTERLDHCSSSNTPISTSSTSRIANLMSQIKTPAKLYTSRSETIPIAPIEDLNSPPTSISPSHLPSVYSPVDSRSADSDYLTDNEASVVPTMNKRVCLPEAPVPELSLEQKTEIQRHIRNNLRPLYKPFKGGQKGDSSDRIIRTEDSYININRSISRKLYAFILTDAKQKNNGNLSQRSIDYYFEQDTKLKELVDRYVEEELNK